MSFNDKARTIIAKLAAHPGLFYEVLAIAKDEYEVLGPWFEAPHGLNWTRDTPESHTIANIERDVVGKWTCNIVGEDPKVFDDLTKAITHADAKLTELGFLLA